MFRRSVYVPAMAVLASAWVAALAHQAPAPSAARILLLPKRIVTGERATLAVLDVNGRLTPGVRVNFSNGEHLTTDATGRAQFATPPKPGVIYATLEGRSARVYMTILTRAEAPSGPMQITLAPQFATLADRFELSGSGFCGEADANEVRVAGRPALVLAASPASLVVLPPSELQPGAAPVEVACAKRSAKPVPITFLELSLEAESSSLKPGEHSRLTVRVHGTDAKVPLEARNLAPKVAELVGGNPANTYSQGGAGNAAQFELIGRERGNFIVSIRLLPEVVRPGT